MQQQKLGNQEMISARPTGHIGGPESGLLVHQKDWRNMNNTFGVNYSRTCGTFEGCAVVKRYSGVDKNCVEQTDGRNLIVIMLAEKYKGNVWHKHFYAGKLKHFA